jgi:hypothetical protein
MTRNIYALLVGINEYLNPIPPLKGCINDILNLKEYLLGRITPKGYSLHLRILLNQDATRQAIIDGFRQHLFTIQDMVVNKQHLKNFGL